MQPGRELGGVPGVTPTVAWPPAERGLQRRPDVGVLGIQLAEPGHLVVIPEVLIKTACHPQVTGDEPATDRRLLTRRLKQLRAELTQGVEHPVPAAVAA